MSLTEEEKESLANSAGLTLRAGGDFFCAFGQFIKKYKIKHPPEISERMFSHMKHDLIPQKNALLAVIAGTDAKKDEADKLLRLAGYVLSDSVAFDVIIGWIFENVSAESLEISRTAYINEILESFGFPLLGTREKKSDN
ncbi:MAG: hypothetical protein LBL87_07100 [Ruminococcus sp.]|jgi:hypothetical protein|nr:hypothetical protein [Ruminococcus sp.]